MSNDAISRATRAALDAVAQDIQAAYTRRQFAISKFGRHPDGYLHARVVVQGQPYYFHLRYGSWLAPGTMRGRAVLKEPEGLLGSELGREVKYMLAEQARAFRRAEQPTGGTNDAGHERRVDGSATDDSGLPDGGDDRSAEEPVRSD